MRSFVLFLGLLALACADSSEEKSEPEPKRECNRMMCRMFCPLGFHLNEDGCPECKCIEDPCKELKCEGSDVCRPVSECNEFPCTSMKAECIAQMPCPMPMCANECPNGYKTNAHGCMNCECKADECDSHVCAMMMHGCIMFVSPLCQISGEGDCKKEPMCIPDGHEDMFQPHNVEEAIEKVAPMMPKDIPAVLDSVCHFRKGFSEKLMQETKKKFADNSMLGRLLNHESMHMPWCTEDGKFKPMQCHAPERSCWCVNDRGLPIADTRTIINSKDDLPACVEHMTSMIEGSFKMAHKLEDVESHLEKIASVVKAHMAEWLKIDAAQIIIQKVSTSDSGMILIQFSLHHADSNELSSAEIKLNWHLAHEQCAVPYAGTTLLPQPKSLKMHHTTVHRDGHMVDPELPGEGWMDEQHGRHEEGFMEMYHHNKVAVICGGAGIFLFLVILVAVVVTLCKRGRVTSNQFKHKRMVDKSNTYKENLAFANEIYGKQAEKPGVEVEAVEEEKAAEPEATEA